MKLARIVRFVTQTPTASASGDFYQETENLRRWGAWMCHIAVFSLLLAAPLVAIQYFDLVGGKWKTAVGLAGFIFSALVPYPLLRGYTVVKEQRRSFLAHCLGPKITEYRRRLPEFSPSLEISLRVFFSHRRLSLGMMEVHWLTILQRQFSQQWIAKERFLKQAGQAAESGYYSGILQNLADLFPEVSTWAQQARAAAANREMRLSAKQRLIHELNSVLAQQGRAELRVKVKRARQETFVAPDVGMVQTILFVLSQGGLSEAQLEKRVRHECSSTKIAFTAEAYQIALSSLFEGGEISSASGFVFLVAIS